ncbi:hypothetical protein O181_063861 [Austropuccinia psidii MF-1]|uniref:Uncharacterized protein n=1 Tax=Austropuccinia psidii MF-1 TaxID=1389203 RepID=A0A9Q3EKT2_9BASI|nr:hypothetical protein [Austropuccinia psidii MF-1]
MGWNLEPGTQEWDSLIAMGHEPSEGVIASSNYSRWTISNITTITPGNEEFEDFVKPNQSSWESVPVLYCTSLNLDIKLNLSWPYGLLDHSSERVDWVQLKDLGRTPLDRLTIIILTGKPTITFSVEFIDSMSSLSPEHILHEFLTPTGGDVPAWTYPALIIMAAIKIITGLGCLALILTPIFRGRRSRKRHLWLVRKRYPTLESNAPYFVPNSSLIIAICELLSSGSYLMLACLNYSRFKQKLADTNEVLHITLTIGYGISFLPTFLGVWLTGWGLLYSCHCPNQNIKKQVIHFFSPRIYNAFWIIGCVLVVVVIANWAIVVESILESCWNARNQLFELLSTIPPLLLKRHVPIDHGLAKLLEARRSEYLKSLSKVIKILRAWAGLWLGFEFFLIAFYIFILQRLAKLIRRLLRFCEAEEFEILNGPGSANNPKPVSKREVHKSVVALSAFRQQLRFLALYNFSITLVLLGEAASASTQFYACGRFTDPNLMGLLSIVVMVPSTFLSPVLLYQSWRIVTERSVTEASKPQPMDDPQSIDFLMHEHRLFHEQLWKWYDSRCLDETECLQLDGHFLTFVQNPQSFASGLVDGQNQSVDKSHYI